MQADRAPTPTQMLGVAVLETGQSESAPQKVTENTTASFAWFWGLVFGVWGQKFEARFGSYMVMAEVISAIIME